MCACLVRWERVKQMRILMARIRFAERDDRMRSMACEERWEEELSGQCKMAGEENGQLWKEVKERESAR